MLRASTRNCIDYSKFRRYDINWDLREGMILSEVQADLYIDAKKAALQTYTAAMAATVPGSKGSQKYHELIFEVYNDLVPLLMPWLDIKKQEATIIAEGTRDWKEFEEFQKTEVFKRQKEENDKILADIRASFETDSKLLEMTEGEKSSSKGRKKIINRVPFK